MNASKTIRKIYAVLLKAFGPQRWWPGDTPFEIMVGAVLTQNTNWGNVEKAIANLKQQKLLSIPAMKAVTAGQLSQAIRPAGYYNLKAQRLKNLIHFLTESYAGDIYRMDAVPLERLRQQLLAVNGIGPETADSILLYALNRPVFVIDAYTRRFLIRHNLASEEMNYHALQEMFMEALEPDIVVFNEYHALIVKLGKDVCRPKARCELCPLNVIEYRMDRKCSCCHRTLLESERWAVPQQNRGNQEKICSGCLGSVSR